MFYLRPGKSDKPKPINLKYYSRASRKNFEYATREKILVSHWDQANQCPVRDSKGRMAIEDTHVYIAILPYSEFLKSTIAHFNLKKKSLTVEALRSAFDMEFDRVKKRATAPEYVIDVLQLFITIKADTRALEESSLQKYKTLKLHLNNYGIKHKIQLELNDLNAQFYDEFVRYCRKDLKLQDNTLGRYIISLKSFLRWADKTGYRVHPAYRDYKNIESKPETFALNEAEVKRLYNFKYDSEALRRTVDVFTIGCYVGQLYADIKALNKENIKDGIAPIIQQKTKNLVEHIEVRVPLTRMADELLKKYNYQLPRVNIQKFNADLKEAAKQAGFNEKTDKTTRIGKKSYVEKIEKWKRITSNVMRRTFIKMSLEKGMTLNEIAMITGHRNLKGLRIYDKTTTEQLRDKVYKVYGAPVMT